jgi:hypothetical protein
MKALVENRDWDGLEIFAKSKKSPIGYEVGVSIVFPTQSHIRLPAMGGTSRIYRQSPTGFIICSEM